MALPPSALLPGPLAPALLYPLPPSLSSAVLLLALEVWLPTFQPLRQLWSIHPRYCSWDVTADLSLVCF